MKQFNKLQVKDESNKDISLPGIYGFHTDMEVHLEDKASLEALASAPSKNKLPTAGTEPASGRRTTAIYKKNEAYHVFFHVSELSSNWGDNLTSFTLWLMSLSQTDIVYIHQTGNTWILTNITQILGTFSTDCKAKKVFIVDHPIENALFLLVCDEVIVTKFGALTFTNGMEIDPSRWDLIYMPYLKSLYAKAVEKKYLTQAEVDSVFNDNAIIFKTAKQLREQGITIL